MRSAWLVLAPMVAEALALGVDEDGGDVLRVADLVLRAQADLLEGVVRGDAGFGARGVEAEHEMACVLLPPAGGERPGFALRVVDHDGIGPAEERRENEADALAAPGRGEREDVLGSGVPEVVECALGILPPADVDAGGLARRAEEAGALDLRPGRPMRRAVEAGHAGSAAGGEEENAGEAGQRQKRAGDEDEDRVADGVGIVLVPVERAAGPRPGQVRLGQAQRGAEVVGRAGVDECEEDREDGEVREVDPGRAAGCGGDAGGGFGHGRSGSVGVA